MGWDNEVGSGQIQPRNVLYSLYLDHIDMPLNILTTGFGYCLDFLP